MTKRGKVALVNVTKTSSTNDQCNGSDLLKPKKDNINHTCNKTSAAQIHN